MPQIFINGTPVEAELEQTVMEAALANGFYIPYFCWHPELSVAGNCRICCVQVEGRSWVEIACNMPVSEGLRVLTDSEPVKEYRKSIMQLMTLNHPVDCGICDKAGECKLQDYHYTYNGAPVDLGRREGPSTKFHPALRAHRARQRALHPVLAVRAASRARSRSRTRSGSSSAATRRSCAPPRTIRSTPTPTPTTSSTSVRSARCFRASSSTSPGSGISSPPRPCAPAAPAGATSRSGTARPSGSSMRSIHAKTRGSTA
jgi:ferredoxin